MGLLRLSIEVPRYNHKSIKIEALSSDTIERTRSLIAAKGVAPKEKYTLIYLGEKLDSKKTLARYNIQNESTLYVIIRPEEEFTISVKMMDGTTLKLKLGTSNTVKEAKAMVESNVGKGDHGLDQSLFLGTKELTSSRTLSYYGIQHKSELEMLLKVPIYIRGPKPNRNITLYMAKHYLIQMVKSEIVSKLKIPVEEQTLSFQGKTLNDDRTLESYNIQWDSSLKLTRLKLTRL